MSILCLWVEYGVLPIGNSVLYTRYPNNPISSYLKELKLQSSKLDVLLLCNGEFLMKSIVCSQNEMENLFMSFYAC